MWNRKLCAICKTSFAVHPKARKYFTRQLCIQCRLVLKKMPVEYKLKLNLDLSNSEHVVDC